MKKIILLALAALMMAGCNLQKSANTFTENDFDVFVYDSCEYILGTRGYKGFLAHKGNCRFCMERRQKELKEFVKQLKEK